MRITSFMIFEQLTRSFQEHLKALSASYNKLSSGKKMDKPSDDVMSMTRAMDYKVSLNNNEQYKRNIDEAYPHLNLTDTIMSSVTEVLTRARELTIEGATDALSADDRMAIAEKVAGLNDQLLGFANSQFRDRYMFSGFKTDIEAFDSSFNYQGDAGEINVMIEKGATIAINILGDIAFSAGGATFMGTLDGLYNTLADPNSTVADISAFITSLDNALGQVSNVRADIGARLNYLDSQKNRLNDNNLTLKVALSNAEDADFAEAASDVSKAEIALQALRETSSRVISRSLLDFLR